MDDCHEGFHELGVHAPTSDALAEALAPAVYEAYRFGRFGEQEHLPMWHEEGARERVPGVEVHLAADAARAHIAEVLADPETVEAVAAEIVESALRATPFERRELLYAQAARDVLAERLGVTL